MTFFPLDTYQRPVKTVQPISSRFRLIRAEIPTIEPAAYTTIAIEFVPAFADASYSLSVSIIGAAADVLQVYQVSDLTASGCNVQVKNISVDLFESEGVTIHVTAIHL